MASTLAVTPAPLPVHLQPIIRVASGAPGTDAAERLRECYALALGVTLSDEQLAGIAGVPIFEVPAADDLLAALDAASQQQIRSQADQLRKRLEPHLPSPLGAVRRDELSCLTEAQQGCPRGTVVLVRESDVVTEHWAFRFIGVDPSDATVSLQPLPQPPVNRGIRPMSGGLHIVQEVLGAGMAVTPFLPPPYNWTVTGAVSLLNLIVGLVAGHELPQSATSPDLNKALVEAVIKDDDIRHEQGTLRGVKDHFNNEAMSQTQPIEKLKIDHLKSIDGGMTHLFKELEAWIHDTELANAQLYSILRTCTADDFKSCLDTLISGITLELTLKHARTMIEAAEASIAYREQADTHKQECMDAFNKAHAAWTAAVGSIEKDVGVSQTKWDDDKAMEDTIEQSSSYVPMIEAWMARARRDRLNQISDTYRWAPPVVPGFPQYYGWTFKDSHSSDDGGAKANLVADTPKPGCQFEAVEHKDVADGHRSVYVASVAQGVDAAFAPFRDVMATWTTYISDLHELLPPETPSTPTDIVLLGGKPPQGEWVKGAQVRYAVAAVNTKGPSPLSEWSKPITVSDRAFAQVGGFGAVKDGDSLTVFRQIQPPGQQDWGPMHELGAVPPGVLLEAGLPYFDVDKGEAEAAGWTT